MIKAIKSPTITFCSRLLSRSFFALLVVAIAYLYFIAKPFKLFGRFVVRDMKGLREF